MVVFWALGNLPGSVFWALGMSSGLLPGSVFWGEGPPLGASLGTWRPPEDFTGEFQAAVNRGISHSVAQASAAIRQRAWLKRRLVARL